MKKVKTNLLLILGLMTFSSSLLAQNILEENFNSSSISSSWKQFSVTGQVTWQIGSYGGVSYAEIDGYVNGVGNIENDVWLISPALDLSTSLSPSFSFINASKYAGNDLQVYVSVDYSGSGTPSNATWTEVTNQAQWDLDEASFANPFINSGSISLSSFIQPIVYIAFRYTSTSSESSVWNVDDFIVSSGGTAGIDELTDLIKIYPNEVNDFFFVENASKSNLQIFSLEGKVVYSAYNISSKEKIDVSHLKQGTYFVSINNKTSKISKK